MGATAARAQGLVARLIAASAMVWSGCACWLSLFFLSGHRRIFPLIRQEGVDVIDIGLDEFVIDIRVDVHVQA